jgi:hypothetical protein
MDKLTQTASRVVLYWHQGQCGMEKRIASMNEALKMARIKAKFVQQDGVAGWTGRDAALAKEFRQEIDCACTQGWVEREIAAVAWVIAKYRNIPWWKRFLRRFRS